MEQFEDFIKNYLIKKELTDIEFFIIKPHYFSPDPDHVWLIDGGVELTFENEKFSFGWWNKRDFYNVLPGSIDGLTEDLTLEDLEARNIAGIDELVGSTIVDVNFQWNYYQEYDENFDLIDEKKFMPYEVILHFSNKSILQLAGVSCNIVKNELMNLEYDSQGHLLIALNKQYDIKLPEDISEDEL